MNIIQFKGRDVILWTMPDGVKQPFYLSSGQSSGMPGIWLPFDGYREKAYYGSYCCAGWFVKDRFTGQFIPSKLYRFGEEKYKKASDDIEKFFAENKEGHSRSSTDNGVEVNEFLKKEGWSGNPN